MLQFSKTSLTMTVVSALVQVCQNAVHWQYRYNNSAFRLSVFDKVIDAQDITASTCAESAEFNACYQRAMSVSLHCTAEAGSDASRIALCGCEVVRAEIACALESCWNVVYGCEYQRLGTWWDRYCLGNLHDIPFFPAPENAPGGCSCNLGQVLGNLTSIANFYSSCEAATGGDINKNFACTCCQQCGELTSLYEICPDTSPSSLGYFDIGYLLTSADSQFPNCAPYLSQYNCVNDLGFPPIGALSYISSLPSSTGTLSPSTTNGSITAPLCDSTCVLTASSTTIAITPTQGPNAGGSSPAGTSSHSPASTTTPSTASRFVSNHPGFLSFRLLMVWVAIFWIG